MSDDAIVILKEDHKRAKKLFREFERASAPKRRGTIARDILEELTVHTYLENEVLYPRVRHQLPELDDGILESYEEQSGWFPKLRQAMSRSDLAEIGREMERMRPGAPRTPSDPKALEKARHAAGG